MDIHGYSWISYRLAINLGIYIIYRIPDMILIYCIYIYINRTYIPFLSGLIIDMKGRLPEAPPGWSPRPGVFSVAPWRSTSERSWDRCLFGLKQLISYVYNKMVASRVFTIFISYDIYRVYIYYYYIYIILLYIQYKICILIHLQHLSILDMHIKSQHLPEILNVSYLQDVIDKNEHFFQIWWYILMSYSYLRCLRWYIMNHDPFFYHGFQPCDAWNDARHSSCGTPGALSAVPPTSACGWHAGGHTRRSCGISPKMRQKSDRNTMKHGGKPWYLTMEHGLTNKYGDFIMKHGRT